MHTIPELLEIAKKKNGFTSDRQLGAALGRSNLAPYRTKGEIPNDMTAFKLADLCGLPAREVLITCHLLKAAAGEHPETHGVWKDVLKMVSNTCIVLATLAWLSFSPAPAYAYSLSNQVQNTANCSLSTPPEYPLCDVVLFIVACFCCCAYISLI